MSVSNTLPDFNANADYSLTAYLNLNGCTLFHGSIDLGTTNLASLMQDPFIGKAVGYLQNAPAVGEGAFGTSWGTFSYDYTASSGLYGAGSDINFNADIGSHGRSSRAGSSRPAIDARSCGDLRVHGAQTETTRVDYTDTQLRDAAAVGGDHLGKYY